MFSQRITIELKYKPINGTRTYGGYASTGSQNIKVAKSEEPSGSDFLKYEHTLQNRGKFILNEIQDDDGQEIKEIIEYNQKISSVSAYYWQYDKDIKTGLPKKVLLLEVTAGGGGTTYYIKNNGSGKVWTGPTGNPRSPLRNDDIERTLDNLNCYFNNEITVDLSKNHSKKRAKRKTGYCCDKHAGKDKKDPDGRVTVTSGEIKVNGVKRADYYEHSMTGDYQVAKIRYYLYGQGKFHTNNPSNRRRIKLTKLKFPIGAVKSIYTFYCGGNPVLIYIEGGKPGVRGWYQKDMKVSRGSTSSKDENWIKIQDRLQDITPRRFSNLPFDQWSELLMELNSAGCKSLEEDEDDDLGSDEYSDDTKDSSVVKGTASPGSKSEPGTEEVPAADLSDQVPDTESETKILLQGIPRQTGFGGRLDSDAANLTGYDGVTYKQIISADGNDLGLHFTHGGGLVSAVLGATVVEESEQSRSQGGHALATVPDPAPPLGPGDKGGAGPDGNNGPQDEGAEPLASGRSLPESPDPQALVGTGLTVTTGLVSWPIFGASSGTLAGSAATFFGGWKLYNRYKGDPWVRQI